MPDRADRGVFSLAPFLSLVPAFLVFCIVPIGGNFNGGTTRASSRSSATTPTCSWPTRPSASCFVLAMSSIAVYGVMLAGWSSGSKYPLLGSVRASAQMVSYEAALGLSRGRRGPARRHAVAPTASSTPRPATASAILPNWNVIVTGVVPFVIFLIAGTAELNRPPFDLVEAEQELVGGFHTEYSSIRFALFFLAEFMNVITMSAIIVTLFLGGPAGPTLFGPAWLWGPIWFFAKVFCFLFIFVWFRATLPRFRYDQLMDLGWKVLIPLALGWLLLLAGIHIARDEDWNSARVRRRRSLAVFLAAYTPARTARCAPHGPSGPHRTRWRCSTDGLPRRLRGHVQEAVQGAAGHRARTRRRRRPKPSASTAATSSTGTRTAWRSASAASCAPASARPAASTCAAPTTRPTTRCRPGERYGFVYEINYLRCIHCDLCVEACPTEAITETKLFEFSFTNRQDAIYTKDELRGRRRRPAPAAAVGGLAARARTSTPRPGCGPPRRPATPSTRAWWPGPASSATA